MKKLVYSILFLSMFTIAISCAHLIQREECEGAVAIDKIVNATVSIEVSEGESQYIVGTGVIISYRGRHYILTAKHVAFLREKKGLLACSLKEKNCISLGSSYFSDRSHRKPLLLENDWAIFKPTVLPKGSVGTAMNLDEMAIGSDVYLLGFPYGRNPWLSKGIIAWAWNADRGNLFGVDGFAAPGFSGGGVFNNEGDLIGIVSAISLDPRGKMQVNQVLAVPLGNLWSI